MTQDSFFHEIISLSDERGMSWETIVKKAPMTPRGWFELSQLTCEDRIDFTRLYWQQKLQGEEFDLKGKIDDFFSSICNIEIFLTQTLPHLPFEVEMIYSHKQFGPYLYAHPPLLTSQQDHLARQFSYFIPPKDFLSFYAIHDGFRKLMDGGIMKSSCFCRNVGHFWAKTGQKFLLPFYQAESVESFQCFFYNEQIKKLTGNISFSSKEPPARFFSFNEWLFFYLGHDMI